MATLGTWPVGGADWVQQVGGLVERHLEETGSRHAADLLQHWDLELKHFVQVCPQEMLDKLSHPLGVEETAVPAE